MIAMHQNSLSSVKSRRGNQAIAVIGANYGDEGKGAVTHFLVKKHGANLVVRFNGGPQAGHTVELAGGKGRHVFHTYGSGTFAGAKTYVARQALFSPLAENRERKELEQKLHKPPPLILVSPQTPIITPWDEALNQFIEKGRGPKRHGSCGMGIGEAVYRHTVRKDGPKVYAGELLVPDMQTILSRELAAWFRVRVNEEALKGSFEHLTQEQAELLDSLNYSLSPLWMAFQSYGALMTSTGMATDMVNEEDSAPVVFEGAQGLLLDENDPWHQPHVTWSSTGLKNVVQQCIVSGFELTDVYYVTRPYLTRHGDGPMLAAKHNQKGPIEFPVYEIDRTNRPNEYQGVLRYAHMDWEGFAKRIDSDKAMHRGPFNPTSHVVMTCLDQILGEDKYVAYPFAEALSPEDLPTRLEDYLKKEVIVVQGNKG